MRVFFPQQTKKELRLAFSILLLLRQANSMGWRVSFCSSASTSSPSNASTVFLWRWRHRSTDRPRARRRPEGRLDAYANVPRTHVLYVSQCNVRGAVSYANAWRALAGASPCRDDEACLTRPRVTGASMRITVTESCTGGSERLAAGVSGRRRIT